MSMKTLTLLTTVSMLLSVVGCKSSSRVNAGEGVTGIWIRYHQPTDGVVAIAFQPDHSGMLIVGSRDGGPVASRFAYDVDGQVVTITPKDRPAFEATFTGDALEVLGPSGPGRLRLAGTNENSTVQKYVGWLKQELQSSSTQGNTP